MRLVLFLGLMGFWSSIALGELEMSAADYFQTADLQLETKSECRQLYKAFNDILKGEEKALKTAQVVEFLNRHLLSTTGKALTQKKVQQGLKSKELENAVKTLKAKLGSCDDYAGE